MYCTFSLPKILQCMRYVEKYGTAKQATDNNILQHTLGYRHILEVCNTYFCYTVIVVTRTRLNITSCVYSVSVVRVCCHVL